MDISNDLLSRMFRSWFLPIFIVGVLASLLLSFNIFVSIATGAVLGVVGMRILARKDRFINQKRSS